MIALHGLAKRFGSREVLAPLDLTVAAGEIVALVGPNGAGKSTTLRMLAGLVTPTSGRATIAGHDVVAAGVAARRLLGYLPQRLGMPAGTVVADLAAVVAGARGLTLHAAGAALADAGLVDRATATLGQLSGGERQRLMLALATMGNGRPGALLLDEPSISLDVDGSDRVRDAIRGARHRGEAVLFASHHLHDVALLADRIALLVDGRLAAAGPLPELARAAGVPWSADALDPPIERIYRVLVGRSRGGSLRLARGTAA